MKYFTAFYFSFILHPIAFCQIPYQFGDLSGRVPGYFSCCKIKDHYFYQTDQPPADLNIYKVDGLGNILDSVEMPERMGYIAEVEGRLFFHGTIWNGNPFTTMREVFTEYNSDLEVIRETEGTPLKPSHGFTLFSENGKTITQQPGSFNYYKDTIFSFQVYTVVDSPFTLLGSLNAFTKTGLNGTLYEAKSLMLNSVRNSFFVQNQLYVQGSAGGFIGAKPLGVFDSKGKLVRSLEYDQFDSGGYLDGALGGWHKGKFYFSYVGLDRGLVGCTRNNAAIDVRDSTLKILHRFKLPDCDYVVSGKMPFSFDAQDNVYYAAPHKDFKKIMVYKFTPQFSLLWKKELDFSNESNFWIPLSQLPVDDGGILLNCYEGNIGNWSLRIFKISADGTLTSSTTLPGGETAAGPLAYPNPTPGPLTIAPEYATTATHAQISTIDGRHLGFLTINDQRIDLFGYAAGMYALTLWDMSNRKMLGTQLVRKE